jgi:hypothetical protein
MISELKASALKEHNVTISSASIARPSWVFNEWGDCFEEAALLANIETFEQSRARQEHASMTMTSRTNGTIVVLDHGQYHFESHRLTWDPDREEWAEKGSISPPDLGASWIWIRLGLQMISLYNSNITESEWSWHRDVPTMDILRGVSRARLEIKFGRDWPHDLDFANRTKSINLTESTGWTRVLNLTGQNVIEIEARYENEIADQLQSSLRRYGTIEAFRSIFSDEVLGKANAEAFAKLSEKQRAAIIANVATPQPIDEDMEPWLEHVDGYVVLDYGPAASILENAIERVLRWDRTRVNNTGVCIPAIETAARGASLRSIQWGVYFDAWEMEMREDYDEDAYWDEVEREEDTEEEL